MGAPKTIGRRRATATAAPVSSHYRSSFSLGNVALVLLLGAGTAPCAWAKDGSSGGGSGSGSGSGVARGSSAAIDAAYFKLPPLERSSVLTLVSPDSGAVRGVTNANGANTANTTNTTNTDGDTSSSPDDPSARVAYGQTALPGQFPYNGLTLITLNSGLTRQCSSTKISERVAMTAAHCIASKDGVSSLAAAFGITRQSEFSSRRVQAYMYSYPDNYSDQGFQDDIGLIAFENEIPNTPTVGLWSRPNAELTGTPLYVAGFGLTETEYQNGSGSVSEVLKYAQVPYISQPECVRRYTETGLAGPPGTHFCAGGVKADACAGDSGGPLAIEAAAFPTPGYTSNIQVGIVSHGPVPCGGPNNIGAYTDVNQYLRWIDSEIWVNNWEGATIPAVKNAATGPTCYGGAVVSQTTAASQGECVKQCKENPQCGSWNYANAQCVQHAMGGFSKTPGTCSSGWLDRTDVPAGAQTEPGYFEYPGASLVVDTLAVSPGGCAVACQRQSGCKYFSYIGGIGGTNTFNSGGANCQLASGDGVPTASSRFSGAVSGTVDGDGLVPPSPPPEETPSPPPPRPIPSPPPPPPAEYRKCSFKTGTYLIRNAGTSCDSKYMTSKQDNCRSKSVNMSTATARTASRFVLKNTGSGVQLTAVKSCRSSNKRVAVSSKNSRSSVAKLSKYATTWRLLSWDGDDCTVVGIQSIARSSRGYSSFLSRSRSCSRNTVFTSSSPVASTSAWQLIYVNESTATKRPKCSKGRKC